MFDVGGAYKTKSGLDAFIKWEIGNWIGGFVLQGVNPMAMRWNSNGVSDNGEAFNLVSPLTSLWVAVFYLRSGQPSSFVGVTQAEAAAFGSSHGNTLISVTEINP